MKINKEKKMKIYQFFLCIFLVYYIVLLNSTFGNFTPKLIINAFQLISYLGFTILIFIDKNNIKKWIRNILILSIGLIIYLLTKEIKIFEIILLILASKDIEFDMIAKTAFYEIIVLIIFIVLSALLKFIPNYIYTRATEGIYRYTLGFTYVGQLPTLVLELIFLSMYLNVSKNKNISLFHYIAYFISLLLVYKITNVRNTLIVGSILILYAIFMNFKFMKVNKAFKFIVESVFLICFSVSVILTNIYDPYDSEYQKLNNILTGRLDISYNLINKYDIKLFGNHIEMYGSSAVIYGKIDKSEYFYIDNLYLQLLYKDGIIISIIAIIWYFYVMRICIGKNNDIGKLFTAWFFIIAIYSLMGDTSLNIVFNIPILAIYSLKGENDEKKAEIH